MMNSSNPSLSDRTAALDSSHGKMKALVCERFGPPQDLRVLDWPIPQSQPGHLLVRVIGAGLNFADLLVLRGDYQTKVAPPFVPGSEIYGVVEHVGDGVTGFCVGDRVIGQVANGGYAEWVRLDVRQAVRLDIPMPHDHAAAFFINYGTAYSALVQRARARAGEALLVLGASGGVGLAAVQIGRALGMKVIADARGQAKRELVRAQGAEVVVDFNDTDFRDQIMAATEGRGCDVILDMVGGEASRQGLRCIAWCGRLVIIGFAGGSPHLFPSNHLLVKNAEVIGHWWGDFYWRDRWLLDEAFEALFSLYAQKKLMPHVQKEFALEEVPAAMAGFEERSVMGKLVARIDKSNQWLGETG